MDDFFLFFWQTSRNRATHLDIITCVFTPPFFVSSWAINWGWNKQNIHQTTRFSNARWKAISSDLRSFTSGHLCNFLAKNVCASLLMMHFNCLHGTFFGFEANWHFNRKKSKWRSLAFARGVFRQWNTIGFKNSVLSTLTEKNLLNVCLCLGKASMNTCRKFQKVLARGTISTNFQTLVFSRNVPSSYMGAPKKS